MLSIHEIALGLSNYIVRKLGLSDREKEVLGYGTEILLGEAWKLLILIFLGYLLKCLPEIITAYVSWASLRIFSGGAHCTTYMRCLVFGHALLVGLSLLSKEITVYITSYLPVYVLCIAVFSLYCIFRWAPANNANWSINGVEERKKYKKASLSVLGIWSFLMVAVLLTKAVNPTLVTVSSSAIFVQSLTLSPPASRFLLNVDEVLGKFIP